MENIPSLSNLKAKEFIAKYRVKQLLDGLNAGLGPKAPKPRCLLPKSYLGRSEWNHIKLAEIAKWEAARAPYVQIVISAED